MAKTIAATDIAKALGAEFDAYNSRLVKNVNQLSEKAAAELARKTKHTAPKQSGRFRKDITSGKIYDGISGNVYAWYVKPPSYRLTHLLVNGHAVRGGGRARRDPFLENACNEVLPAYEKAVEKAVEES